MRKCGRGALYGLNGSGYAPRRLTADALNEAGYTHQMALRGRHSVTVPGAPSAWTMQHERFGKLPFHALFEPALDYAQNGFAVSPTVARFWREGAEALNPYRGCGEIAPRFETFAPDGAAPRAGDIVRFPDHARTLRSLAQSHCESFYRGEIAQKICEFSRQTRGFIDAEDLARYVGLNRCMYVIAAMMFMKFRPTCTALSRLWR